MKPSIPSDDDAALERTLRQWTVDATLPPRFEEQVWQRIARVDRAPQGSFWAYLRSSIERALLRPKIAGVYVAALLTLGATAGAISAQVRTHHLEADLGERYVQSINPFQLEAAQP